MKGGRRTGASTLPWRATPPGAPHAHKAGPRCHHNTHAARLRGGSGGLRPAPRRTRGGVANDGWTVATLGRDGAARQVPHFFAAGAFFAFLAGAAAFFFAIARGREGNGGGGGELARAHIFRMRWDKSFLSLPLQRCLSRSGAGGLRGEGRGGGGPARWKNYHFSFGIIYT